MGASRNLEVQRRAKLKRKLASLRQHQAARDEDGKSAVARKGGLIGGPARAARAQLPGGRGIATHNRLDDSLRLDRTWSPDKPAMLAALRVVLGLPRRVPETDEANRMQP